ncbi:MAG: tetratricopeptide repeat protein, partial [Alphaproteobacteria bacterium]|nr:tetratricopeptide repeat protein [Alphaproteobacteria bacterium]
GAIAALGTLAQEAREPYATLARLRQAALMAEAGDKAAAATFADAAAKSEDPLVKEYAELMAVVQSIGTESPDAVISRLEPMAGAGKTWRNLARDYLGFVAFKKGDLPLARRVWDEILKDDHAAPSQKARANELLTATAPAASDNKGTQ